MSRLVGCRPVHGADIVLSSVVWFYHLRFFLIRKKDICCSDYNNGSFNVHDAIRLTMNQKKLSWQTWKYIDPFIRPLFCNTLIVTPKAKHVASSLLLTGHVISSVTSVTTHVQAYVVYIVSHHIKCNRHQVLRYIHHSHMAMPSAFVECSIDV